MQACTMLSDAQVFPIEMLPHRCLSPLSLTRIDSRLLYAQWETKQARSVQLLRPFRRLKHLKLSGQNPYPARFPNRCEALCASLKLFKDPLRHNLRMLPDTIVLDSGGLGER